MNHIKMNSTWPFNYLFYICFCFFQGNNIYIFPTTDDSVLHQAKEVAMEAKHSGQYTDTNTFRLECKECGITITGEDEALAHAKKTGHSKFEEIHRN